MQVPLSAWLTHYSFESVSFHTASNDMGAQQSTPGEGQVVYSNETPIQVRVLLIYTYSRLMRFNFYQFSQDVINHLSDTRSSPNPAPERQQALDAVVQERIHSEMKRLHEAEVAVQADIEAALERENLDREKQVAEKLDGASSEELRAELDEVQRRAERFKSRLALGHAPEVKESQARLVACYKCVLSVSIRGTRPKQPLMLTCVRDAGPILIDHWTAGRK